MEHDNKSKGGEYTANLYLKVLEKEMPKFF
jgi:hypothetical protein